MNLRDPIDSSDPFVWSSDPSVDIESEVPKSVDYRKLLQEDADSLNSLDDQIDEVRHSLRQWLDPTRR